MTKLRDKRIEKSLFARVTNQVSHKKVFQFSTISSSLYKKGPPYFLFFHHKKIEAKKGEMTTVEVSHDRSFVMYGKIKVLQFPLRFHFVD